MPKYLRRPVFRPFGVSRYYYIRFESRSVYHSYYSPSYDRVTCLLAGLLACVCKVWGVKIKVGTHAFLMRSDLRNHSVTRADTTGTFKTFTVLEAQTARMPPKATDSGEACHLLERRRER